jgi:hypothetical protein
MAIDRQDPSQRALRPGQLQRVTFRTSRLLDFCSQKELTAQTGHPPAEWPLVIVKELIDNALDACEEAGTVPCVTVTVNDEGIDVTEAMRHGEGGDHCGERDQAATGQNEGHDEQHMVEAEQNVLDADTEVGSERACRPTFRCSVGCDGNVRPDAAQCRQ